MKRDMDKSRRKRVGLLVGVASLPPGRARKSAAKKKSPTPAKPKRIRSASRRVPIMDIGIGFPCPSSRLIIGRGRARHTSRQTRKVFSSVKKDYNHDATAYRSKRHDSRGPDMRPAAGVTLA